MLIFGESPIVKVIDFFLDNREFDYIGIVVETRRIGRAKYFLLCYPQ